LLITHFTTQPNYFPDQSEIISPTHELSFEA
jgi:hypothetical protein